MVKEIEVRRNGEWGQRLLKDRAAVGNVMDGLMERAIKEICRRAADAERRSRSQQACVHGKTRQRSQLCAADGRRRKFAAAASFAAKHKTATEEIGHHLRRYIEDAVRELKGESERRRTAEFQLNYCAELVSVLFSQEEAEFLRRRVRAAQVAAA